MVTDAGGLSVERSVRVDVLRTNRPPVGEPVVTGVVAGSPRGTLIDRILATDPDSGDVLQWSLASGNDGGTFVIDPDDGTLRVASRAGLSDDGRVFELVVRVRDDNGGGDPAGILSTDIPVRVTVTADNSRPRFDDGTFPAVREDAAAGTRVGSVAATDPDAPLLYRIVGGDPDGRFRIDADTGEVFVTDTGLDFETDQSHRLEIAVTDSGAVPLTSLATFEISVIDANEAPEVASATFDLPANAPLGTLVGEIEASDPDRIAGDRVRLEIVSGNESGAFEIDPRTGTIKVVNLTRLGSVPGGVVRLRGPGDRRECPGRCRRGACPRMRR
ncbi:MAG: cadherin repeat domain-containing protein [Gammaproteobacteria bacterium]|nr:cadherin repeat domain-containing protein [Gammaproteobacteria bacterium]